jgi:hypothetical protein
MGDVRRVVAVVALTLAAGCGRPALSPSAGPDAPAAQAGFDPATAGRVHGRVVWQGDAPEVPNFRVLRPVASGGLAASDHLNPNSPFIEAKNGGMRWAVVSLRGIDPDRAKPWDIPPALVEVRDGWLMVWQGGGLASRAGFVRHGDEAEFVSREKEFVSVRGRGASFFALAFPDADKPSKRRPSERGVIELSSGAGHYWMRAYLFADDHPYYALTDTDGSFDLTKVPPGRYELVCWHPNWHTRSHERDPETGMICRMTFADAAEVVRPVTVPARGDCDVMITLSAKDFAKR